jgi:hypothetical protein
MKKIHLIAVGVMLSVLAGCSAIEKVSDKAKSIADHIHTLKTKGCETLSESAKSTLVFIAKSKVANYPDNGICNPDWVRDVLVEKLKVDEVDNVQNESIQLGYKANRRLGSMDQPSSVTLLFTKSKVRSIGSCRLLDRSCVHSQVRPLVHASIIIRDQSSSHDTRSYIHRSMHRDYQAQS